MTQTVLLGDILYPVSETMKFTDEKVIFLNTSDIEAGKFLHKNLSDPKTLPGQAKKKIQHNDILFSEIRPANKRFAYVDFDDTENHVVSTKLMVLRSKDIVHPKYAYHWLTAQQQLSQLQTIAESRSGTFPQITFDTIKTLKVVLPDYPKQVKIADFVDAIDEKIELNRKMNETFEQMGQALFRHYFIDNPEAEKWEKRELGEFFPIKTGKKDANFGTDDGEYPFFTCAQTISKAPDFSFDAHALLLAGNGDFNLKLYRGKFEAYQRTYVLAPNDERLVGVLYFLMSMKLPEITGGSRGSVIKFITKGMIENYRFALPKGEKLIEMAAVFNQLTINIEENVKQIQTLTTLRDTLLPRLINGKIIL